MVVEFLDALNLKIILVDNIFGSYFLTFLGLLALYEIMFIMCSISPPLMIDLLMIFSFAFFRGSLSPLLNFFIFILATGYFVWGLLNWINTHR
jgi:hypothetical protein